MFSSDNTIALYVFSSICNSVLIQNDYAKIGGC
jgi:hypothetical protein